MIRAVLPAFLLAAAAPVLAAEPMCANAPAPGFAPGQASLADKLAVGRAVELALKPAEDVPYPVPLARRAAPGTFGGVFPLEVKAAGTFRLLLSAHAWLDVMQGGAALVSTDHQHGAPCSGVAKIVAFKLEPGRYDVQLSEAETRALTVKVSPEAVIPIKR